MKIEVPAGSPFFAGHFPGHPILPGVAHLALVAGALPAEARIAEISSLRLRSPVRPGDPLDLRLDGPAGDGAVRFDLLRGTERVSQGVLRMDLSNPDQPGPLDHLPEPTTAFPPIETLVPHAPPARLVRSVLEVNPEGLAGVAEIPSGSPFVEAGRAPAFLGLEAAAQGAAVLEALDRKEQPGPRIGYLVGIRDARLHVAHLPADRPLRFAVRLAGSAPPLAVYEVVVEGAGGRELVRGTISTYLAG